MFRHPRRDDDIVDRITPALSRLIETEAPDIVLAPQAVGAHVDHVAVYRALSRCSVPMQLWTDFPYSIRPSPRPSPFAADIASLTHVTMALDDREVRAKRAAASCYASQLGFQFGGSEAAEAALVSAGAAECYALARPTLAPQDCA